MSFCSVLVLSSLVSAIESVMLGEFVAESSCLIQAPAFPLFVLCLESEFRPSVFRSSQVT